MKLADYFSQDYHSAHDKFIRFSKAANAKIESFEVGVDLDNKPLTIDIAYIGQPNPEHLVVITSGIHGIEAYAGSAVQCQLLDQIASNPSILSGKIGLVLIHPINPFGMAYKQRVNKDNIDLNRNGDYYRLSQEVIQSANRDGNQIYKAINEIINPEKPYRDVSEFKQALLNFLKKQTETNKGLDINAILNIVMRGQLDDPNGIFYKGDALSNELKIVYDYLKALQHPNLKSLTALDMHTGLGKKNDTILGSTFPLLLGQPEIKSHQEDLAEQCFAFDQTPYQHIVVKDMLRAMGATDEEVKQGGKFSGSLAFEIPYLFDDKVQMGSFLLEFGTAELIEEIYVLVNMNSSKPFGKDAFKSMADLFESPHMQPLTESFYPSDSTWQEGVLLRGMDACFAALRFAQNDPKLYRDFVLTQESAEPSDSVNRHRVFSQNPPAESTFMGNQGEHISQP